MLRRLAIGGLHVLAQRVSWAMDQATQAAGGADKKMDDQCVAYFPSSVVTDVRGPEIIS